ncbi:hypothetical protein Tco_0223910 [Tanacetum coccineum]
MDGDDDQTLQPTTKSPQHNKPLLCFNHKNSPFEEREYSIWHMNMEHYLAHTDYPVWEVIQNGNGPVSISTDTQGQIKILPPKSAEEILARERERKARTTLLMAHSENIGYNGRDQRTGKQEQPKALLTIDAGVIDWSGQAEEENHASYKSS